MTKDLVNIIEAIKQVDEWTYGPKKAAAQPSGPVGGQATRHIEAKKQIDAINKQIEQLQRRKAQIRATMHEGYDEGPMEPEGKPDYAAGRAFLKTLRNHKDRKKEKRVKPRKKYADQRYDEGPMEPDRPPRRVGEEIELAEVHVDHTNFEFTHGRKPRGRGRWYFTKHRYGIDFKNHKEGEDHFLSSNTHYSKAKQEARKWARSKGHHQIYTAT